MMALMSCFSDIRILEIYGINVQTLRLSLLSNQAVVEVNPIPKSCFDVIECRRQNRDLCPHPLPCPWNAECRNG